MPETNQGESKSPLAPAKARPVKRKLAIAIALLAAACALWFFLGRSSTRLTSFPLTSLGFTNSPDGEIMAKFSLSNSLASQITFFAATEEKQGRTWPMEAQTSFGGALNWSAQSWDVAAMAPAYFEIPVPSNRVPWRVWVQYRTAPTTRDKALNGLGRWLRKVGLHGAGDTFEAYGNLHYMYAGPEMGP